MSDVYYVSARGWFYDARGVRVGPFWSKRAAEKDRDLSLAYPRPKRARA